MFLLLFELQALCRIPEGIGWVQGSVGARPKALPPVSSSWLLMLLPLLQVWGDRGPREVLAVEASGAMSRLASRVWQEPEVQAAVAPRGAAPRVRWMSRLPRESGDAPRRWALLGSAVLKKTVKLEVRPGA